MEELKVISKIVTQTESLKTFFPNENIESKEGRFLENIRNDVYADDEHAASDLYFSDPKDVRYKMLKYRLKKKLYNKLFFVDYQKFNSKIHITKEQECYQLLHHANFLLSQFNYDIVLNLTNKVLTIAQEYDLTNLTIAALELMQIAYSDRGQLKQFTDTEEKLSIKLKQKACESKATSIFQLTKININRSVKARKSFMPSLPEKIKLLQGLWEIAGTFDTFNSFYKTSIFYYELTGDFTKIVEITVLSEKWIKENRINNLRFDLNYNRYILVYAHLRAKEYESGLKYAEKYIEHFDERSINWFAYMENYFLLALHSKKYELAYAIITRVTDNNSFKKITKIAKERWGLYSAYLFLFSPHLHLHLNKNYFNTSFSPEYSKDKQGFNVAILILQFVHFLKNNDSEVLLYRIESLKKYINTHLKDSFSLRSRIFLKLLILTVTEDFESDRCRLKGQKLYQKLIETPTPGDAYAEIEIVPYEHLWELILSILESKV